LRYASCKSPQHPFPYHREVASLRDFFGLTFLLMILLKQFWWEGVKTEEPVSFRSTGDTGALYQVMLASIANLKGIRSDRNRRRGFRVSLDNLVKAVTESEVDYIAFGNRLNKLYEKTSEVSKTASSLISLTMGERLNAQIRGLNEVIERTKILAAEPGQGIQSFTVILEMAKQLEMHLVPMANIVGTLQALSNLIKIEIARVGVDRDGFGALSEEVIALAETIRDKSLPMIDQSSSLTKLVEENLARILSFKQRQEEKIRLIRARVMTNLGVLSERHEIASRRLNNIAKTWAEITHSIGEIVSAMQFHDITRQRIEHVSEALIKTFDRGTPPGFRTDSRFAVIAYLKKSLRRLLPFPAQTDMAEAYQNCLLQKAQLLHTKEDLISSSERIGGSLETLANRIGEMSGEAREVTEHARGSKASFFSEMEKAMIFVTEAINECSEINEQTTTAVDRFTTAIAQMEGFLKGVVKIGIEMKMVSLNAAIHAAQFGQEGMALGVLADYLHESSQSTSKQIGAIGEGLQIIFENAAHLFKEPYGAREPPKHGGEQANGR
jgi:hypothetical protein